MNFSGAFTRFGRLQMSNLRQSNCPMFSFPALFEPAEAVDGRGVHYRCDPFLPA